ncbi:MAG: type IV secretory system conjugative DNA transfer family protein [Alphaproteobacteria bacterium]
MNDPFSLSLGNHQRYSKRRRRYTVAPFELHSSQRLRHMLVLGKSGMGKSTALTNYALSDIRKGLGCLYIDPHHDDAENLLELIPPWRRKDVIYFNPAEFPVSFNVLDNVPTSDYALAASFILDTIKTIWHLDDAPNVDMFVQASIVALLERGNSTLLGLNYILDTPEYRKQVIRYIGDPVVRHFWERTFDEHMTDREQRDRTLSTINKVFTLIVDPAIRHVVGQKKSAFNFADVLRKNQIVIISVPHGRLGIKKASIIVGFLLANFHVAALQRPKESRTLYPLYLNEAHHFINETILESLTGLRKFGIAICLSHQSLRQIYDRDLRAALVDAIGAIVAFRLGPNDAEELSHIFLKTKADDLIGLRPHQALADNGNTTTALTMPDLPRRRSPGGAAAIRRNCRHLYGRPLAEIETEIGAFMASLTPTIRRGKRGKTQPDVPGETPPEALNE